MRKQNTQKCKFCFNLRVREFDWKSKITLNLIYEMTTSCADSLDAIYYSVCLGGAISDWVLVS